MKITIGNLYEFFRVEKEITLIVSRKPSFLLWKKPSFDSEPLDYISNGDIVCALEEIKYHSAPVSSIGPTQTLKVLYKGRVGYLCLGQFETFYKCLKEVLYN